MDELVTEVADTQNTSSLSTDPTLTASHDDTGHAVFTEAASTPNVDTSPVFSEDDSCAVTASCSPTPPPKKKNKQTRTTSVVLTSSPYKLAAEQKRKATTPKHSLVAKKIRQVRCEQQPTPVPSGLSRMPPRGNIKTTDGDEYTQCVVS